jgi:thymidylate synthase (FAD)
MTTRVQVLDSGYVELVETWGSDERIIEAARMSTQKGFEGWGPHIDTGAPGDEKLLAYLYENAHATPFEFAGLVIEVQAPIFVFREWHRHRTQSYNEMSARYAPLPNLNYIPSMERLNPIASENNTNKQAGTLNKGQWLTHDAAESFRNVLSDMYFQLESVYQSALAQGVPKELARVVIPVGRYSRMRASTCLRNWLAFLTLRMDSNAQWEIRQYANAIGDFIKKSYPRTWELFELQRAEWQEFKAWRKAKRAK